MQLFKLKSFLLGVSLASTIVSALPFPSYSSEVDVTEREYNELLPRTRPLFPPHGKYSKEKAVEFVKSIPLADLGKANDVKGQRTLYKADGQNEKVDIDSKVTVGHRLDHQGMTTDGYHNLQVQLNGKHTGKSTVGGILIKGTWPPNRIKHALVHSVMHPGRDKDGNEHLHKPRKRGKKVGKKTRKQARKQASGRG